MDREKNLALIHEFAADYLFSYLDPGRDLGLHMGLNWVLLKIGPKPGDVIITYDPDSQPETPGFDHALAETVQSGEYEIASSFTIHSEREFQERGYLEKTCRGRRVFIPNTGMMIGNTAWSCDFLKRVGGFKEPNAYYGGIEAAMTQELRKTGGQWAFLPDVKEGWLDRSYHDTEYTNWKVDHAAQKFKGSFADYLSKLGSNPNG